MQRRPRRQAGAVPRICASPGDYLAVTVWASDGKARLYKRENDGSLTRLVLASSALSLTTNTWYEGKVVTRP